MRVPETKRVNKTLRYALHIWVAIKVEKPRCYLNHNLRTAFKRAMLVIGFEFLWASRKKPPRNLSYSSFVLYKMRLKPKRPDAKAQSRKENYSLFATRETPSFIRKAPKLMRSPGLLSQSPLSLRLCAFA